MLSKRIRLALSAGALGVALAATLGAAANAGEAPGAPAEAACTSTITVTEKDGDFIAIVDGKEVEGVRVEKLTPTREATDADAAAVVRATPADAPGSGDPAGSTADRITEVKDGAELIAVKVSDDFTSVPTCEKSLATE
ncbi:hypothetical protein [Microtetraspora malaysiensis]|uniref:hypothetical protein n=1 Tax=Microtetraspora malaysiensis TaxID=161358 RepID=UPI003D8B7DA2